ncbi:hypothetical protein LOD99_1906 [Oopsacas minuta]|uniref:Uncharacterized protein n=1 Tax=Oopsacas minuta TaxID=111878 RepID=A0AAV7K4X1_9METZ|nr:hypothetical protein LOD99_1906 [Oopsacas minuta]
MLFVWLIICIITVAHSVNIRRDVEYVLSRTESGLYPLSSDNSSLFYWYIPTLSPRDEDAPLLLWLGDGQVSIMKDVFGKDGPFSIIIQQNTADQIEEFISQNLKELAFPFSNCEIKKINTREVKSSQDEEEEEGNEYSFLKRCRGHHKNHYHCRTTTRQVTIKVTSTKQTTTPTTTTPTTTTPTTTTPTTTTPTTTTPTTTTPTTTTPTTTTPTTTTPTTTTPTTTTPTTSAPTPVPVISTTPRPPPPHTTSTPLPPFPTVSRISRDNTIKMLQQLFINIPISLNSNSLLTSYNILYIDSTVGYATGKPTHNILTAVTSLINSLQPQHYSTHNNIALVASVHMLEILRVGNTTELYYFLSHSLSSLRVLQTERDENTECLMSVCTLRQLSKCPRMMSLYYWMNEAEGNVRDRLGIRNGVNENVWIPYYNHFKHYPNQPLQRISNLINNLNIPVLYNNA